jgi:diguanylate cyclase (GGDEF)-like protein/PAS domain S-box-containing protein
MILNCVRKGPRSPRVDTWNLGSTASIRLAGFHFSLSLSGFSAHIRLLTLTLVIAACFCVPTLAATSIPTLKLKQNVGKFDLRGHVALYEDKSGNETIDTLRQKIFHTVPESMPSLGSSKSAYWVKLVIESEAPRPITVLLQLANQYLDFIEFYVISNRNSHVEKYRSGARVPWEDRISQGRYPVLNLDFSQNEEKTIFIRIQSRTPLRIPLDLSTEAAHERTELAVYLFNGLFFGVMGFLIIYSLFAWSILRQNAYFYYILLIVGVVAFKAANNGFFPRVTIFFHPETILHLLTAGICLAFIFNIIFVSSFMNSRAKYPILYGILRIFLIFAVINLILYCYDYYLGNSFAMIYGPILGWVLVIAIGLMWYWGESYARYLFFGHILLPIFGMVHVSVMFGLIPYNFVFTQLLKVAYLSQGMFFALALADRYSMMQKNFQRILEDEVAERSEELVIANESLHQEINERKRVEKAIERAKNEWEQTFDTVPDLIAIIDRNYNILRANKAIADKLNTHPREMIGKKCYEVCHGIEESIPMCPLNQSLADGKEHSGEILINKLGGVFLISVTPLPTENGEPEGFVHVARDITERKILEARLRKLAITDGLTNIWNRRHFIHLTGRELERTRRYGGQMAIAIIDLDDFKSINDTYGHDVGDEILKKVAEIVRKTLRKVDIFARYGGEEFVIAFPETGLSQAVKVAERLCQNVSEISLNSSCSPWHLTMSVGLTVTGPDSPDLMKLLKQADEALYEAKSKGKNRVEVFCSEQSQ